MSRRSEAKPSPGEGFAKLLNGWRNDFNIGRPFTYDASEISLCPCAAMIARFLRENLLGMIAFAVVTGVVSSFSTKS
jgi:hypothetical protein